MDPSISVNMDPTQFRKADGSQLVIINAELKLTRIAKMFKGAGA